MTEIQGEVVESTELVRQERGMTAQSDERSVDEVLAQMDKVKQLMTSALTKDEHYGVIPGTVSKPTLLQPGAQKLCFMFRLVPTFDVMQHTLEGLHREYEVKCQLSHASSGQLVGEGVGLCSTMESKYRWRKAERVCPACGADTIKRSKFDDKGWYCYAKIGGCGKKFDANDPEIVSQETGRKENSDIADTYNTVLKMAKKRAFVDATLTATAASDSFTQDVEDLPQSQVNGEAGEKPKKTAAKKTTAKKAEPKKTGPKGVLITADQKKELWDLAKVRAEKVEKPSETIMRDLLAFLNAEGTADIPAAKFDEAKAAVERWDPEVQFGE